METRSGGCVQLIVSGEHHEFLSGDGSSTPDERRRRFGGDGDRPQSVRCFPRLAKGAIGELERAIDADPTYFDAVVDLAEILVSENRLDEAEKRINALIAEQPTFHRAKLTLGLIKLKLNLLAEAQKLLPEALVMNPDPIRAHYYLGQLHEKKGEHKIAMQHYRDALERCLNER